MTRPFSTPAPRDYRIDFFRGLALMSIFVNHIPGNLYANFTHRNLGLSDAAEVFVLLAGVSAAFAYYPRFVTGRAPMSLALVAKRVGTLYIAQLASVAVGFAIYAAAALLLDRPELMLPDERHWMMEEPLKSLAGIGALTYQTGNFNILPMYVVLLLMLPAIMLLARLHLALPLVASVALWFVANLFELSPPAFPAPGGWFFNPLTWQLVFVIGFVMGVKLRRGEAFAASRRLYMLAVAYLVLSAVLVIGHLWDYFPPLPRWVWLMGFDKSWVGVFRLLHLLALVYVVVFSPLPGYLSSRLDSDNWIVRLGRNTLPVFWLSIPLSVTGHILREQLFGLPNDPSFTPAGLLIDTVLVGSGLALLFALARLLDWTSQKPRGEPAVGRRLAEATPAPAE